MSNLLLIVEDDADSAAADGAVLCLAGFLCDFSLFHGKTVGTTPNFKLRRLLDPNVRV